MFMDANVPKTTTDLITERGKTHGDYSDHAQCSQNLKYAMQEFTRGNGLEPWQHLSICAKESLEMIAHKIGRILAGDPDYRDHWDDIAGYAKLAADRCSK